ncbi:hypothetical protein [Hyphomonas atlantica]|uniref:hypothetical protein n=1 Tax=Hyphomonas atlantica TaxID=1280948 RepID=UPI0023F03998|nr:hypothetical protein [Hyphomonas atlantica]
MNDVYSAVGGIRAIMFSSYFGLAVALAASSWRSIIVENDVERWTSTVLAIFPSLAGFSIAAFALLFALLDEHTKRILSKPSDRFNGKSPLIMVVGILTHALIIQIITILYALVYQERPLPDFWGVGETTNRALAFLGVWLLFYGILLMIAVVLTIFKMVELLNKPRSHPPM